MAARDSQSRFFRYSKEKKEFTPPDIPEERLLDTNFTCRLLRDTDEDMLAAIRCLYSAYGFDCLHEDLYFFDSFRRKLNSGTSLVATGATLKCTNETENAPFLVNAGGTYADAANLAP